MNDEIGEAAGKVWSFLNENGASTAARIMKGVNLSAKAFERAIGWLAREDKLAFEKVKGVEKIGLR